MTKQEIIRWTSTSAGKPYSFIVNVITCHQPNKARKLKALYSLAQQDRISDGNSIDTISIDGHIVPMRALDQYA